ncbi:MAG: hypothetical protein AAF385_11765, partial [Pseudomonadota bacterium]
MKTMRYGSKFGVMSVVAIAMLIPAILLTGNVSTHYTIDKSTHSVIVVGQSAAQATSEIERVGGVVSESFDAIDAVITQIDAQQAASLMQRQTLHIFPNNKVDPAGKIPESYYPAQVSAERLRARGVRGDSVSVAVVDTGMWSDHEA